MMSRNQWSNERERFITRQTELHNYRIDKAQSRFLKLIQSAVIAGIVTDDNGIPQKDRFNFLAFSANMDGLFADFAKESVEPIVSKMQAGFEKLYDYNTKYFASIKENDQAENVKSSVFGTIGITGGALAVGSLLWTIINDREALNTIKAVITSAIQSGLTITALKIAIEEVVLKRDGGILRKIFEKTAPEPFVKVDRFIQQRYGVALGLNYAIYQGGIITTSRPFCRARNNKVFSRDEIAKFGTPADTFGGYDNPTTGEFQGKPDNYNPFTDIGGYNCRHQFDFISDELAFALRPSLSR